MLIDLTRTEFSLLELFMRNPRQVLTRSVIFERVWGYDFGFGSNSLDVYIGYPRRKTEAGDKPRLIQTVRGVGYALREPSCSRPGHRRCCGRRPRSRPRLGDRLCRRPQRAARHPRLGAPRLSRGGPARAAASLPGRRPGIPRARAAAWRGARLLPGRGARTATPSARRTNRSSFRHRRGLRGGEPRTGRLPLGRRRRRRARACDHGALLPAGLCDPDRPPADRGRPLAQLHPHIPPAHRGHRDRARGGSGLAVARTALALVRRLTGATERVTETRDLWERIDASGTDELSGWQGASTPCSPPSEESTRAQQLVGDASHELRTPLTSLRTNVEVLAGGRELPEEERQRLLHDILEQLNEMTTLVAELSELARGEPGGSRGCPARPPRRRRGRAYAPESTQCPGSCGS